MDFEAANRKRDRRLRRRLLSTAHAARVAPLGGLHGRRLVDVVADVVSPGEQFEGDDHAIGLLRDLEAKALVTLADERTHPKRQRFGLDFLFVRATARGAMLLNETAERDPDVEDPRDPEGE